MTRDVVTGRGQLADDLRGHPLVSLTTPGDPTSLADGLRRAMAAEPPTADAPEHEGWTKRDVLAWWLAGGAGGRR